MLRKRKNKKEKIKKKSSVNWDPTMGMGNVNEK